MTFLRRLPLHPFLFAAYPVLALLALNLAQIRLSAGIRPLIVALVGAGMVWLALRVLLRDWRRAAAGCSLLAILFFSYGHLYNYLERQALFGLILGRHRLLIPLWLGLAALGLWWAAKRLKDLSTATLALNVFGLAALAFPLAQIAVFGARAASTGAKPPSANAAIEGIHLPEGQSPPDVYYIILDAYTRGDILQSEFDFDNSPFLDELTRMGFFIGECSQSNYAQTELSLTTALNLDYLEAIGAPVVPGSQDRSALWPLFRRSAVRQAFERMGYRIVAFDSGFFRTQLDDADVYLSRRTGLIGGSTGFEVLLVKTSAGLIFTDAGLVLPMAFTADVDAAARKALRETVLYEFDELADIPQAIGGPKFVFVHVMAPHEPFVFGPNGEAAAYPEAMDDETYRVGYREEIAYLNQRVAQTLREIIANSDTPPIIIIQGDHGAGVTSDHGRMSIFNAYYLPGGGEAAVYPAISPVNSFRVVFNTYFGGSFEMLEDVSYYSVYDDPYNFRVIPQIECDR